MAESLGCVPLSELDIHRVSKENFENMEGFMGSATHGDIPFDQTVRSGAVSIAVEKVSRKARFPQARGGRLNKQAHARKLIYESTDLIGVVRN